MDYSRLSNSDIQQAIKKMQRGIEIKPNSTEATELQQSIDRALEELQRRAQKKSEAQSQSANELPTKAEMQEWANREEETNFVQVEPLEKQPDSVTYTTKHEGIKTVKAPVFEIPDELINVELEDLTGLKYVKTFTKAQVRAETRRYFGNIHKSWQGKERKMKRGFRNMLAFIVAWQTFNHELPSLRDVLPDYDRYNKGSEDKEASDAFKVAKELYGKIVEILNPKK